MATTSAAARQLSDGNSQGTILGNSVSDAIGFYNVSSGPVTRQNPIGSQTLSTAVSSTGAFGFGDAGTASTIVAAINALKTMGLIG